MQRDLMHALALKRYKHPSKTLFHLFHHNVKDIFVQYMLILIHQTKQCIRNNVCTTNASITNAKITNDSIANTLYLALLLYTLPNDPKYVKHYSDPTS